MKLGERIYNLRNLYKMSQEDLAQKLNVSRQSISKWENNTSVPELEKLMQLSELFQMTLDELVKGESIKDTKKQTSKEIPSEKHGTQRIIGFILLTVGLISIILAFAFSWGLAILGGYLGICGTLCLLIKKHAGLVIGWMTFILVMFLMTPFTGVRMFSVMKPSYWYGYWTMNHIWGVLMWAVLAVLLFFTYYAILKKRK